MLLIVLFEAVSVPIFCLLHYHWTLYCLQLTIASCVMASIAFLVVLFEAVSIVHFMFAALSLLIVLFAAVPLLTMCRQIEHCSCFVCSCSIVHYKHEVLSFLIVLWTDLQLLIMCRQIDHCWICCLQQFHISFCVGNIFVVHCVVRSCTIGCCLMAAFTLLIVFL